MTPTTTTPPRAPEAAPPSPPAIAPMVTDADVARFRAQDPQDIVATLQALAADGDLVTLYPPNDGAFLSGRVHAVQPTERRLVIEAQGSHLPDPGAVLLVAMPRGIKLQFHTRGHWQCDAGGPLLLTADLPDEIVHLQRRRFRRMDVPLGPSLRAEFALHGEARTLNVDDLSQGGIGLRAAAHDGRGLMSGQRLRRVRLELGQRAPLMVDLEICSRRAFRSFLAGEQLHFGCRFIDLAPEAGAALQYILRTFDTERQQRTATR